MNRRPHLIPKLARLGFYGLACILAGLALYPNLQLPEPTLTSGFTDKIYHVSGCASLLLLASSGWRIPATGLALSLPLSFAAEVVQILAPGRGVDLEDMLANLLGVSLGILVLCLATARAPFHKAGSRRRGWGQG